MIRTILRVLATVSLVLTGIANAADSERGRHLYENHCSSCHESQVHIRAHSKVRTPAELRQQIERWRDILSLDWIEAELDDVQAYLNAEHYQFDNTQ